MMQIRQIEILDILEQPDATEMFAAYAEDGKGSMTPNVQPDHDVYYSMENAGLVDAVGAYNNGRLVGFLVAFTTVMPHYSEPATTIESIFVYKNHRKHGTGKRMLDMIEDLAAKRGSKMMFMSTLIGSRIEKVASSYGYTPTNTTFTKKLS